LKTAHKKKFDLFDVVNTVIMLILEFVTIYPFLYIINVSLSSKLYVMQNAVSFWPKGFTLEWYKTVLQDSRIGIGYRNTILYTVLGTSISLVVTSMGAFALSQPKMIFRKFFNLAIVFTMLFGGGMIPAFLLAKSIGITDTIWGMILPGCVNAWNMLVFRTFFNGLPSELFDAGKIDGLNDIGIFRHVVIPLSKAVYAAIGLFVAVGIWNNYSAALIYLRDANLMPLQAILRDLIISGSLANETTARAVSQHSDDVVVISLKYATIIVSTLPILLVYPFLQKYFVKGTLIGSVKA
jgi:putative aldouronate transport system permease protein